jgi:hypothetical protein
MERKICLLLTLIFISIALVSAVPGIPHQFYGDVIVNGKQAPDNNKIIARIDGDEYKTAGENGKYGYSPDIFYIEDPDGNQRGETINFFVGGMPAGSAIFQNNGYTKLNFDLTTTCGDGYCLGTETCSNCETDCGICTDPPIITIISPEQDKVYDTAKVDLKVSANQRIFIWYYNIDNTGRIQFNPNITLTLKEGAHELTISAVSDENDKSGSRTVSFFVDIPESFCGDGICQGDRGETCSTCLADCGACSSPKGGGGGGSSGGGGASTASTGTGSATQETEQEQTAEDETEEIDIPETKEENKGFFSMLTGAVIGGVASNITWVIIFILAIMGVLVYVSFKKKRGKE